MEGMVVVAEQDGECVIDGDERAKEGLAHPRGLANVHRTAVVASTEA